MERGVSRSLRGPSRRIALLFALVASVGCQESATEYVDVTVRLVDHAGVPLEATGSSLGEVRLEIRFDGSIRNLVLEQQPDSASFRGQIVAAYIDRSLSGRAYARTPTDLLLFESSARVLPAGEMHDVTIDARPAFSSGLAARESNAACLAFDRPPINPEVGLQRFMAGVPTIGMVDVVQVSSTLWYVVLREGAVLEVSGTEGSYVWREVIDLRDRVLDADDGGELGMMSLALHPDFAINGEVFVYYTTDDPDDPDDDDEMEGPFRDVLGRISRLQRMGDGLFDGDEEAVVLDTQFPTVRHHAGTLRFGLDGFLYTSLGDGEQSHSFEHAQNVDTLPGSLIRIDVDSGDPYGIPADNPFAGGGGRPELYAWGLRNPWRFSVDSETGELWVGDVGKSAFEEVNIVERGGNYGWSHMEGPLGDDSAGDFVDPHYYYSRDQGIAIIGGFVYRGDAIPYLQGRYVFGDFGGRVWALRDGPDGVEAEDLTAVPMALISISQGLDGELYLVRNAQIFKIVPAEPQGDVEIPQLLSETGCVDPDSPRDVAPGVINFDVAHPLWSDGADKQRWMALPDGEVATVDAEGTLQFPVGTVLMKRFSFGDRIIEDRFLVLHEDGEWGGYAYEWNDEQTDAVWLPGRKRVQVGDQDYEIPGQFDCLRCHSGGTTVLGPTLSQLASETTFEATGVSGHQLETLIDVGILDFDLVGAMPPPSALPAVDDPDADLEARARAYLHVNCAPCHRDGALNVTLDFHIDTPLSEMGVCDTLPRNSDFGIVDARLLAPGEPERSILSHRINSVDPAARMPPIGRLTVDTVGAQVVDQWIESIASCP